MRPTYRVTEKGRDQIRQWLLYEWCLRAEEAGDLDAAVNAYTDKAEDSEDGEIEMREWDTASGRLAHLRPEREVVLRDYTYRTDGESGTIEAATFEDACAQLDAMVPQACIEDGGWGWVDDCDDEQPRYELGRWW